MAFNFDPDAFVRGATGAADLYNKLTFEPEQQRQALETQRLQQQAYKNQIATSEFDLAQKQKAAGDVEGLRNIEAQKVALAQFGEESRRRKKIGLTSNNPDDIIKGALVSATPGILAASGRGAEPVIAEGSQLMQDFSMVLNTPTKQTSDNLNNLADRAGKYLAKFTWNENPDEYGGRFENGKVVVTRGGKDYKIFENPMAMAMDMKDSTMSLEAYQKGLIAAEAKFGGEGAKIFLKRAERNKGYEMLAEQMTTPEGKQAVYMAMQMNDESAAKIVDSAVAENTKRLSNSRTQAILAKTEPIVSAIKRRAKGKIGSAAMDIIYQSDDEIDAWLAKNPDVAKELQAEGLNPASAIKAQITGKLSSFEQAEKVGEIKVKEREAAAKELAAKTAGTKAGTNTESSENIKITLDSYVKELAALEANPVSDKNRKAFLVKEIDTLREALKGATRTPSGKKAEAAIPTPQGKFGTLTDAQLTQLLNKL